MKKTVFNELHIASGAKMVDFGGWHMPVSYSGTLAEHKAVREDVGLFDVSHMGELRVKGPNALAALQHLVSNDVAPLGVGQSLYAALMHPHGGIVDDLFVYRLRDDDYLVCINAGNRDKDFQYFVDNNPHDADITNISDDWAQVAIQGRRGPALTQSLTSVPVIDLPRGAIRYGDFAGVEGCMLARTGYTGEDGFEIFIPTGDAAPTWQRIVDAGALPIGLGARDTLRLEARNVLYGNDIDDETSPLEAGLGWITKLGKGDFLGRDALVAQKEAGLPRRLVGLVVDKRIPRPHCPILNEAGEIIGEVTSGSRSPTVGNNIALGYVRAEKGNARPGNRVVVDIRGRQATATVVKGPFWKRDY